MSDVLPLLLLPALLGWWFAEWRSRRTARRVLHQAISSGRPPMLADAGIAPVTAVARSLEVVAGVVPRPCPVWIIGRRRSAWDVRQLAAPLALELDEVIGIRRDRLHRPIGFTGASRFSGDRHGRSVDVELGVAHSRVEVAGASVLPAFTVGGGTDGRLRATGNVPAAVEAACETLAPSRHWRGASVVVEASSVCLRRETIASSSWLHDLWLVEFIADLAQPPASTDGAEHPHPGALAHAAAPVAVEA